MRNPFVITGYRDEQTFCDRQQETARIIHLLENGNNIVLSSPRRVGKTDLIQHVFAQQQIRDNYLTISTDIYATQSFADFVACLGKSILDALRPRGKRLVDNFLGFLSSIRSQFSFDISGMPVWSIGVGEAVNPLVTLDEIFRYIENAEKPVIIAIDEFQQILKYKDAFKVEALLRTHIQACRNANFIYAGSHQHLMAEIFVSSARPFYMSATLLNLPLIDKEVYADFCQHLFDSGSKHLERDVVYAVYDKFNGITAYMQRMMNELYAMTSEGDTCHLSHFDEALNTILAQSADSYQTLYYQLTDRQRATMLAIATEGTVKNPLEGAFIKKYGLNSASSANSSIKTLSDKDLVTKTPEGVSIYDHFFRLWLLRR